MLAVDSPDVITASLFLEADGDVSGNVGIVPVDNRRLCINEREGFSLKS